MTVIGTPARSIASRCQCAIAPHPTTAVRTGSRSRGLRDHREPLEVVAEAVAHLVGVEAEVAAQVVLDPAVLARGGCRPCTRRARRGLRASSAEPVARVDPLDHRHVVGHELVEEHVDGAVGGQEVAVAHARPQQPVDAIDPVRRERFRLDRGRRMRSPYASIVIADWITDTGSRCVTANVASGNVASSAGICSRCCGDFSTQRFGPRRNVSTCSTFFMYA